MGECDHAVKVSKICFTFLIESSTDVLCNRCGAIYGSQDANIISCTGSSIGPKKSFKCGLLLNFFWNFHILPKCVIPLKITKGDIMGMDMLSGKNGLGCKTDDLIVFSNRLIDVDPSLGYFVSRRDRSFCGHSRRACLTSRRKGFDGNCDIIIWMQFYRCWIH